ncbi:MAG TPA: 3-hydroxyacyl-CoA dehydrogenase NAD-binding domain-containing protein [Acholeplasmataceae bacterium]|mgnify:FL=1|nr:3-hydroxyacyl-CoA dehydrogenase NAD-binding domain-containing protein [Acholeplasmataceae bacterium]HQC30604.1 3-hydroxyacyl-CoA dehydrogenase NAD-binding domain-containing protein [Acholeplasmataceae bacterium]
MDKKIGVIGLGTMGTGIVQVFLSSGYRVLAYDLDEKNMKNCATTLENRFQKDVLKERISLQDKETFLNNLKFTSNLNDFHNLDLVIESVIENIDVKKNIFVKLDKICKEGTIFGSNTSSLSIKALQEGVKHTVVGIHFFNPPYIMKLIELVKIKTTPENDLKKVYDLTISLNKSPVVVNDSPGFVVNRILIPMINEAIHILDEEIATAEDIDKCMNLGANHPIGPLKLADLIGNDIVLNILNSLYNDLNDEKYKPSKLLERMVKENKLGVKTKKGFYDYN